ncbi:hypothetical protein GB937_006165 [Aspergillus fischeri]|nr:hypothetical protein GB937_006165 [Aspergillus fischeri]
MTEEKTTQTLKSDTVPKSKRLCNVSVKEPKPQAKKEPEVPSKRTNSNSGPTVLKTAKLPVKEQSPAATEKTQAVTKQAICRMLVSMMLSTAVGLSLLSLLSFPLMLDLELSVTLCLWDNLAALNLSHPLSGSLKNSIQRANPYTESFFRDMARMVTKMFPWELFAQEHECTVPEVSVAFCALIFAIMGDPEFIWKKEEHLTTAQFGNMMILEWWKYYLSVLKPRARMYQMMQPPTRTTIFTPCQGAWPQTQMVETFCENLALGISHREELHARIKEEVEMVECRWLENRSRR